MGKKDNKDIVWFGMKLTPEEKSKIKLLAKETGVSQKEAVMSLVNEAALAYGVEAKPGSMLEKMQPYIGVMKDGPSDLSTNPKYLEGYGENNHS